MAAVFQSTRPIRGATSMPSRPFALPPISIHAPHTGRDICTRCPASPPGRFQSTRPIRGATPVSSSTSLRQLISIHAPHTGRDIFSVSLVPCFGISIHAPHTGRDIPYSVKALVDIAFQSTRPIRGATSSRDTLYAAATDFNPRAPYGARQVVPEELVEVRTISIHAPHTGRDDIQVVPRAPPEAFQSTRPIRGATSEMHVRINTYKISIHAPHTGRDSVPTGLVVRIKYFNPRAPYGARRHFHIPGFHII